MVCASLGGVFFLAFLAVFLFCLAKKKKKPVMVPAAAPCVEEEEVGYAVEAVSTGGGEICEGGGINGSGSGGAGGPYESHPPYQPHAPEPPTHAPSYSQQC